MAFSGVATATVVPFKHSVWSILASGHDLDPTKIALIAMHQPAQHLEGLVGTSAGANSSSADCLQWSYAQLKCGATRLAAYLETQGISKGATLITFVPSCAEWALLLWTAALGCYTLIALDPRTLRAGREDELRRHLSRLSPDVILVQGKNDVDAIDSTYCAAKEVLGVALDDTFVLPQRWTSLPAIARAATAVKVMERHQEVDSMDRLVTIMFSSGTSTGLSKGCPITVKNLSACMTADVAIKRDSIGISNDDNFRSIALVMSHRLWKCGATLLLPDYSFSPGSTLRAIEKFQATVIGVVPILTYLLHQDAQNYSREAVRSLKYVFVTGDVITSQHLQKTAEVFPEATILSVWGMTEGIGVIGWPSKTPADIPTYRGVTSCGVVLQGAAVRLVDVLGNVVKCGNPGELFVSSDCMINQYMDHASAESFTIDGDGRQWFRTGDIAVMDDDGYLFVIGRNKDIIKSNGIALAPACVEYCLLRDLGIQAAIIGIRAPIFGELPYAIVEELPAGVTPSLCARAVLRRMGRDYALGGVLTLAQIGLPEWPRSGRSKISKLTLKEAAEDTLGRQGVGDLSSSEFSAIAPYLKFGGLAYDDFPNSDSWEDL